VFREIYNEQIGIFAEGAKNFRILSLKLRNPIF